MRTDDFLLKAFENMNVNFSSNEFTKELRKLGCPERVIWKQKHLVFLHINCIQDGTRRSWIKRNSSVNLFTYVNQEPEIAQRPKRKRIKQEPKIETKKVGLIRTLLKWIY